MTNTPNGKRPHVGRLEVDRVPWPHPRPSRDPRIVMLNIALAYVAVMQGFVVRPESSIAAKAYENSAAVAVSILFIVAAVLVTAAAFHRSQFTSWALEAAGCGCFAAGYGLQFAALYDTNPQWFATSTLAWSVGYGGGNLVRAGILAWRLRP